MLVILSTFWKSAEEGHGGGRECRAKMRRVLIAGGGFTGAAAAIQLARAAPAPLDIAVVEPRESLGGGLAYGGADPDHRVNGTHALLVLFPEDIGHFARWFDASGGPARDPEARWDPTGVLYVRRSEVRRYMAETLAAHAAENPSGSRIRHLRDRAAAVAETPRGLKVTLAGGGTAEAETLVLALAGAVPALPGGVSPEAAAHPGFVRDPLDEAALARVPSDAAVLLVGSGLTAADVVATLARQGHRGPIAAVSRRGLRPEPQGAAPDAAALMARLSRPLPRFLERHGEHLTLAAAFRALRSDLRAAKAEGRDPKAPFDDARDAAARLWPQFSPAEKRRFLRHLKPWYDVNRYRMVPQTGAVVARLGASGQLEFRTARFVSAAPEGARLRVRLSARGAETSESFDSVILCTGPQSFAPDPFLDSLTAAGLARPDPLGLGIEVDGDSRVIDAAGRARDDLWAFGLLTRGRFGDMTAIPQIAFRLSRSLPALARAAAGG